MRLQGVMREGGERRAGSAGSVGLQISQVFTLGEVGALEGGGQRRDGILFRCFRRPLAAISGTGRGMRDEDRFWPLAGAWDQGRSNRVGDAGGWPRLVRSCWILDTFIDRADRVG